MPDPDRSVSDLYPTAGRSSTLSTLAVGLIVIAALYFAREVFVPLALSLLLSFALGPLAGFKLSS